MRLNKTNKVTEATNMIIKAGIWNSGIELEGEGELVGKAEEDEVGVTVGSDEDEIGVGEESGVVCEKLWKTSVAGLAVPSWLNSPSSKV